MRRSLKNKRNLIVMVGTLAIFMLIFSMMLSPNAYADAAENMWNTITELISKWVLRLGGVVVFVGLILFGLGWKNDDPSEKTRGIQTIIAGVIVMVAAGLAGTFFSPDATAPAGQFIFPFIR